MQVRQDALLPTRADAYQRPIQTWLADVERQIQDALAQSQASTRSCQMALATIAELRSRVDSGLIGTEPAFISNALRALGSRAVEDTELEASRRRVPTVLRFAPATDDLPVDALTTREVEVLTLIANGQSNKAIAQRLFLSIRTVERHINNIYRKIDARNKADATAYAFRNRLA